MKCIRQLISFSFVAIAAISLFASIVDAKLGDSHNNERSFERYRVKTSRRDPLDKCQGDCDVDADCKGNLICFHRQAYQSIPGCQGGDTNERTTDYCIDLKDVVPDEKTSLPELKWLGQNPDERHFPLQECEGDCDKNSDCADGLVCLQRRYEKSGPVPGCWGRDDSLADYCVKSSYLNANDAPKSPPSPPSKPLWPVESTTPILTPGNNVRISKDYGLKMYWEPHYMWQEENFDRRWCMECRDGKCDYGDKTIIHTCERAFSQRYDFILINNDYNMIRLHGTNLCFERISMDIFLYDCDLTNRRQHWVADFRRDKFEIKPLGLSSHCVTQRHHPKFYEEVEIEPCQVARSSYTSYWTRY